MVTAQEEEKRNGRIEEKRNGKKEERNVVEEARNGEKIVMIKIVTLRNVRLKI